MNKKVMILITCLFSAIITLTSCTLPNNDLMNGIKSKGDNKVPKQMDIEIKDALMNFSWRIFHESSQKSGNIMISPVSIYLSLAMALNGADGETRLAMLETLSAQGISEKDLNSSLRDWINILMNEDRKVELSIANSIWYRDGFEANQSFLQNNADYFSASIKSLDFSKQEAVNIINDWVKDATKDTIDKIIENIDDNAMMYIMNAIYFKGDWKEEFKANNTYKSPFNAPSGVVDVEFMHRSGNIDYLKGDGVTGIFLPYIDDQYAFIALLTEKGQVPKDLMDHFTPKDMSELIKNKKTTNINLALPKFESSYEDSFKDELSKLGMGIAFDPNNADFSLMKKDGNRDLFISEVKHKTFICVDEKGTEASAVTSIEVTTTSMQIEVEKLVFDRPFIYSIVDLNTGLPLFMGIMENPSLE